jgi:hypothetical protein
MASSAPTEKSRDILASGWRAVAVFWFPAVAMVVAASSRLSSTWITAVWTAALFTMGTACIASAVRCGRVHCYLTGPFFLVMALVTFLYGLGALPLGQQGWNVIGLTVLVGGAALCCLPEMILGKYRKRHARNDDPC